MFVEHTLEKPSWLRVRAGDAARVAATHGRLRSHGLETVCEAAKCPNLPVCWREGHATFLILGKHCTRGCAFCNVERNAPMPVDPTEPERVAAAVSEAGVRHAVVTSVTRDDLPDGGAAHWAAVLGAVKKTGATVEALVPDFQGRQHDISTVLEAGPDVFGHNLETVPRLYGAVRPGGDYTRALGVLRFAAGRGAVVKTSLLLGLGEREEELARVFDDAAGAGCRILFLGQYLRPSPRHAPVAEYVRPGRFEALRERALATGFAAVAAGPLVRSSFACAEQREFLSGRKAGTGKPC